MLRHADFPSAEAYSFSFQAKALLQSGFTWQCDPPASPYHALPGKPVTLPQCPNHLPRRPGKPRCTRNSAIS